MVRVIALVLLLCGVVRAETVVLPTIGKAVGVVTSDEPGKWIVMAADFSPVSPDIRDGGKVCIFEGLPGRYAVFLIPPGDGQPRVSVVILGGVVPPPPSPTPTPPAPPNPTPGPQPTPPAGKRTITIIREAQEQTTEFGTLIRDLRSGAAEKYLRDKGHQLYVLDSDQLGSDGKPTALIQQWAQVIGGIPRPVMVISDSATRQVLLTEPLSKTASDAAAILEAIKKSGG